MACARGWKHYVRDVASMFRDVHQFIALSFLSILAASIAPASGAELSAAQLVDEYQRAVAPYSRVTYTAEFRGVPTLNGKRLSSRAIYGVNDDEQGRAMFRIFYRRDDNRLDVLSLKQGIKPGPDAWQNAESHLQHVIVDNSPKILDYANLTDNVYDSVVSQRSPKQYTAADSMRQQAAGNLRGGELLDGFILKRPDKSLPEILRGAADLRVNPNPQVIGGHETRLLECTDGIYSYQVFIDPNAGFHPRRIVQKRVNPNGDGADVIGDDIQIEKAGDRFVPVALHTSFTYRSGPDYLMSFDSQYRRSDIDFNPNFEALNAFKMIVRPGTYVRNEEFPEIAWRVKDGKVVPKIPENLIDSIDDAMKSAPKFTSLNGKPAAGSTDGFAAKSSKNSNAVATVAASGAPNKSRWLIILTIGLACAISALLWFWRRLNQGRA